MKHQSLLIVVTIVLARVLSGDSINLKPDAIANEAKRGEKSKGEAYVTLLYGDNPLPVRVLGLSLKLSGTQHEMIALCTEDVTMQSRRILENDGWTVKSIETITSPYSNCPRQYSKSFSKLLIWTLTEYRRIVFLDSDTLVYANIDELFRCGKFCAAYRHSDLFNAGVLVVKPDLQEYKNLMSKIGIYPSYDSADQGFLNYYYRRLMFAPMFNASNHHYQEELMRLPALYNADISQYYVYTSRFFPLVRYKVLHHTLGPVKPWRWWAYPIFDLNWHWVELRDKLLPSNDTDGLMSILWAISVNVLHLIVLSSLRFLNIKKPDWLVILKRLKGSQFRIVVATLFLLSYALGFTAIPDTLHPYFAIPSFCLWTLYFLQLFCFLVGLVTCTSQMYCFHLSIFFMFVIVVLLFMPLVVPLYVPAFFTRVCVFLTLVVLCTVCSHLIIVRSLHRQGQGPLYHFKTCELAHIEKRCSKL